MIHGELAERTGASLVDLESLFKGSATENVARRLGVLQSDIEDFIRGKATFKMTQRLGLKAPSAAQELAKAAGKFGAAGIVVGLLLSV